MTQPELFCTQHVGNLTREVPLTVGRIAFSHALPDMRGQPPPASNPTYVFTGTPKTATEGSR